MIFQRVPYNLNAPVRNHGTPALPADLPCGIQGFLQGPQGPSVFRFPAAAPCPESCFFLAPFLRHASAGASTVLKLPFSLTYLENPTHASTSTSGASEHVFLVLIYKCRRGSIGETKAQAHSRAQSADSFVESLEQK